MLNANNEEAVGVIFPNCYDSLLPELVTERLMASVPFAGRYRLVDFIISSMVHSGIDDISLIVKKNYHSLMDHLGSGQEFDLARKKGGLNIVPPYSQKQIKVYGGRIEALESLKGYLKRCSQKYVVLTDANYAISFDFRQLISEHKKSGADVTVVYRKMEIPEVFFKPSNNEELYYSMDLNGERVSKIYINPKERGEVNYCMNMYVIEREKLIALVDDAYVHGYTYYTRDLLAPHVNELNIHGTFEDKFNQWRYLILRAILMRICVFLRMKTGKRFLNLATIFIQRSEMIIQPDISKVQLQRIQWLQMDVLLREALKIVCFQEVSESVRALSLRTVFLCRIQLLRMELALSML